MSTMHAISFFAALSGLLARMIASISYHRGPTFNKLSCSESHFVDKQIRYTLKIVQLHKMFFFDSSVRNNQHQNVGGHTDGD